MDVFHASARRCRFVCVPTAADTDTVVREAAAVRVRDVTFASDGSATAEVWQPKIGRSRTGDTSGPAPSCAWAQGAPSAMWTRRTPALSLDGPLRPSEVTAPRRESRAQSPMWCGSGRPRWESGHLQQPPGRRRRVDGVKARRLSRRAAGRGVDRPRHARPLRTPSQRKARAGRHPPQRRPMGLAAPPWGPEPLASPARGHARPSPLVCSPRRSICASSSRRRRRRSPRRPHPGPRCIPRARS